MPLQTVLRVDGAALGGEEQAERRRAKLCERLDISVPEAGGGGGIDALWHNLHCPP